MEPILFLVVPILLAAQTGIDALPLLVLALDHRSLKSRFEGSEAQAKLLGKSAALRDLLQRLQGLGFRLLGLKAEKIPLWGPTYRELALISTEAESYAGIVLHPDGSPASLYFYTPIQNGGMVFTRNFPGPDVEWERYSVRSVPAEDPDAALAAHRLRIQGLRSKGLRPQVGSSQQARLDATDAFYASEYGRKYLPQLWSPPIRRFLMALIFLVVVIGWIAVEAMGL